MSVFSLLCQNEPHWLTVALISAIVGFLLPYVIKVIVFLFLRFRKNYLEGKWHHYHWTYLKNNPILIHSEWRIKKGILHRFIVQAKQIRTKLFYKGYIKIEGDGLFLVFHSNQHDEHPVYRFPYPISSNCDLIHGLWLSFDHDKKIASGGSLLSRNEIPEDKIVGLLKSKLKSEKNIILSKVL